MPNFTPKDSLGHSKIPHGFCWPHNIHKCRKLDTSNPCLTPGSELTYGYRQVSPCWPNSCQPDSSQTAIRMTSSSRDIYFHMSNRNQTKLWPVEKYWLESFIISLPSLFLINSFSSFLLIYLLSLLLMTSSVYGHLTARNYLQCSKN